ncbi:MurR/RpiR family transcriptional regulator [Sporosarcina cyprini]|uniref:MurR/RpiR family transcriptional regulator n=1 Tax=Sporosarcina cyprini TaxID=2910523 RepID=UPI001EDE4ED6|nr:MurR/RpiR family transcriptional regulator [Sporosarcina cyprini]MCG3086460.1 MurR/RpiR family transcriptional regulator [Sporosarcina cyprini]
MTYYAKTKKEYEQLTPGLKKVAEVLLHNPILFATHPAKKIAQVLDVSETMVVRFSKAIGYDGFGSLQADVQRSLLTIGPPEEKNTDKHPFSMIMESDSKNIIQIADSLEWDVAEKIVECLVGAETIKVIGYYQSFAYAHWFTVLLNTLLGNTSLYRPETDIGITKQGSAHSVVIFSYYRYALGTIRLAEEARQNGNEVILITDSLSSPVVELADHTLVIPIAQKSVLEKGPATFSVLNSLLLHIANRIGKLDLINPTNNYYIK